MKKKDIQNKYKKKLKLIHKLNKFYFDKSEPIVSDKEYDELKKEIILLEKQYDFLKSNTSPSKLPGVYFLKLMPGIDLSHIGINRGSI